MQVCLHDARTSEWRRFLDPEFIIEAGETRELARALDRLDAAVAEQRWFIAGFLTYEAAAGIDHACKVRPRESRLPLAWFAVCRRADPVPGPQAQRHPADIAWRAELGPDAHAERVARTRALIGAGDTYQLNLTYRLRAQLELPPETLLEQLLAGQGGRYGGLIETREWAIASASPELLFERDGDRVRSRPMKGTAARGHDGETDANARAALARSAKDRAENLMITDMLRNDLGRIALPGTVSVPALFDIEPYPSMWQMTSEVTARSAASIGGLLRALFPGASITGAPKLNSMRLLRDLERSARGIYTGTVGFVLPDGRAQFNVAIRTAEIDLPSGHARYGVGGGIVWDSDAGNEWSESLLKARPLPGRILFPDPPQPARRRSAPAPAAQPALLETLAWTPKDGFRRLRAHLDRLAESARALGHATCADAAAAALSRAASAWRTPRRVRLIVAPDGAISVTDASLDPLPAPYRLRLTDAPSSRAEQGPHHKTTDRAGYDHWLARAHPDHDALLWNEHGELTESCIANVALAFGDTLLTPPSRCGLLPGLERAALLAAGTLREAVLTVDDLAAADGVFLCNSVRGLWEAVLQGDVPGRRA